MTKKKHLLSIRLTDKSNIQLIITTECPFSMKFVWHSSLGRQTGTMLCMYTDVMRRVKKVEVGNDQEKAQSERNSQAPRGTFQTFINYSHSKNRGEIKPNGQLGTYT